MTSDDEFTDFMKLYKVYSTVQGALSRGHLPHDSRVDLIEAETLLEQFVNKRLPPVTRSFQACPDCGVGLEILDNENYPFCPQCNCMKPKLVVIRMTIEGKEALAIVPENLVHWDAKH